MKRILPRLLILASLLTLSSCASSTSKKKCGGDEGVCHIGDEKRNPNKALWILPE